MTAVRSAARKPAAAVVAPAVPRVKVADEPTQRALDHVAALVDPVVKSAIASGVLVADVKLPAVAPTKTQHKLGRVPLGVIVVRRDSGADVYDSARDSTTLTLVASSACTVSLWVF